MSDQLRLALEQPLRYAAASFVVHEGVADVVRQSDVYLALPGYRLLSILGDYRTGKTHLEAVIRERLTAMGLSVLTVRGDEALEWKRGLGAGDPLPARAIIIDDVESFLRGEGTSPSALFVDLDERARASGAKLVLLSSKSAADLGCNAHVTSRIGTGLTLAIRNPGESELDSLLDAIARQRGLRLSEFKRGYLLRRAPRAISGLVDCLARLDEVSDSSMASTSFHNLGQAVEPALGSIQPFES